MNLLTPIPRPKLIDNNTANIAALKYSRLITALNNRQIPDKQTVIINSYTNTLNNISDESDDLTKKFNKFYKKILFIAANELKLVTKNYYRNLWMAVGMASFGITLGLVFGIVFKNMAFMGIGLPFGFSIGLALGTGLDKKAEDEGRVLDI